MKMIIMKIFKKNQILFFVAALALVTTGYLAYNPINFENQNFISTTSDIVETSGIGDATLVSSTSVINEVVSNIVNDSVNTKETSSQEKESPKLSDETDDYFTSSRIDRDKMYSQMLESYQKIIDNTNMPSEQKSIATKEIENINNTKNAIMISENLIKTKGIQDVIIFVNLDSINIVIKAKELTSDKVAQIQNIISRELNSDVENIHISNK